MTELSMTKSQTLKANGTFNPHAQRVRDALFQAQPFFDPHDRLQVKYEMLRRVRVEGWPVAQAAVAFGFSRLSFYKTQQAFEQQGLNGLGPRPRGPKGGHKLTAAVMDMIRMWRAEEPALSSQAIAERLAQRLQCSVHPRSIERALARLPKKGDLKP
jgi:transposase